MPGLIRQKQGANVIQTQEIQQSVMKIFVTVFWVGEGGGGGGGRGKVYLSSEGDFFGRGCY
jgi:hypothetical protein